MIRKIKNGIMNMLTDVKSLKKYNKVQSIPSKYKNSPDYLLYLARQLEKSERYSKSNNERTTRLIQKLLENSGLEKENYGNLKVLCVGCRNTFELDLLLAAGFGEVVGIDLFSSNPRIQKMDMHKMVFERGTFDIVYSCHNLEHSFNPDVVANEFRRVSKEGGKCIIEVPVNYETGKVDLYDFGGVEGLRNLFGNSEQNEFLAEQTFEQNGATIVRYGFTFK